jgi:uncharacterized membrane protein
MSAAILSTLWNGSSPVTFDYFSGGTTLLVFLALATLIVIMGIWSLNGQSPARRWVAIGLRLMVVAVLVLILAGARWNRQVTDLEVVVVRDTSRSADLAQNLPESTVEQSTRTWIQGASSESVKPPGDRIGVVRFARNAQIEAMPARSYFTGASAIANPAARDATDVAAGLRLALATISGDALHRIVLMWDGTMTTGDLDSVTAAAAARHIPIDIMPLEYHIEHEVILERLDAPVMKREGEPFSVRVVLRSTNAIQVKGRLRLSDRGRALDMDLRQTGMQTSRSVTLQPGINVFPVEIEASEPGVRDFSAAFEADDSADDHVLSNNAARGFTFIRGKGRVLYVDNAAGNTGHFLADALQREHIGVLTDHISADGFPRTLAELQSYDAVILSNVPRGMGGLDEEQDQLLATYVHDLGGGLIVIGGPDSFGAGGWIGSKLEQVLPVDCSIPARRVLPAGLLVLVLDHSGSMGETVRGTHVTKQWVADQSAVLAVTALSEQDLVGVVAFDGAADWVVPVRPNTGQSATLDAIKRIGPAGGTYIPAGLELACQAVEKVGPNQAAVKHVLLMTDGQSQGGDYEKLVARLTRAGASLSTVGIGDDVNPQLLTMLAKLGKGRYYPVADPTLLPKIFIKEARTIRRTLIQEEPFTPAIHEQGSPLLTGMRAFPPLRGLVLTSRKNSPNISVPLVSREGDPVLAHWQAGLGKVAAFTSDASSVWASAWTASDIYDKFWAQAVRWVIRPPISTDFDVMTRHAENGLTKITVLATDKSGQSKNFLRIAGQVIGPNLIGQGVSLTQTGPGRFEGEFKTSAEGNYVGLLRYSGPGGETGTLPVGTSVESSAELRVLSSDNNAMLRVVNRTGGRMLRPWDVAAVRLFTREGLQPEKVSLPAWDYLVGVLIVLFLFDVAARRLAWGRQDLSRAAMATAAWVRSFTTVRKSDARPTLDAYRQVRQRVAERAAVVPTTTSDPGKEVKTVSDKPAAQGNWNPTAAAPPHSPKQTPTPSTPNAAEPPPDDEGLSSLKAAKRRTQRKFEQ